MMRVFVVLLFFLTSALSAPVAEVFQTWSESYSSQNPVLTHSTTLAAPKSVSAAKTLKVALLPAQTVLVVSDRTVDPTVRLPALWLRVVAIYLQLHEAGARKRPDPIADSSFTYRLTPFAVYEILLI